MGAERDPLLEILGHTFARVSVVKGRTRLSFRVGDEEAASLEVASRAQLTGGGEPVASGSRSFVRHLKRLRGQPVSDVRYLAGRSLVIAFGKEAELHISLREGDFPGDVAASLKVGGVESVSYNDGGMTRLALRPEE
ncbi:MAG TPA: hypothetical protein VGB42_13130 [Candidatus Thermoplasmatota archaeon]